jgi:WS/DGAT/MGAT family acyltransferase
MPHTKQMPMRQLSGGDAAFIYSDTAHTNSNVSLLHIYDQTTAPKGVVRFKQILTHVENRLSQLPVLRQKILRVPLDLDYPYWIEDENFDIEYHVRHIALPKPGDWRQFCIQAARIHARPLDLQRPLWEMYVIEGLDSFLDLPVGSFAVLLKIHHAAVDVSSGHLITALLHDLSANPSKPPPPAPWFPQESPSNLALMWRAGFHAASFPLHMLQTLDKGLGLMSLTVKTFVKEYLQLPEAFPLTRFNTVVSPRRVFDTRRFAFADFRLIRSLVKDATVNDVVLAVCAGALRRYLELQGELPDESLVAAAPISVRDTTSAEEQDGFAWARVSLFTQIKDPVTRLQSIADMTSSSEVMSRALGARELTDLSRHAPSAAISVSSKMLRSASARLGDWAPLANCNITNVPGPQQPLYLLGARLSYLSAIMPIADGMGLVFSVTSYNDMMVISFTGCYEQLPDPENLAQCLRDSFQEYLELASRPSQRLLTAPRKTRQTSAKKTAIKPVA